jgi:hypothetical protein
MHSAALASRTEHDGGDGLLEAEVVMGDHAPHSGDPAFAQGTQERGPECFILAVADGAAQHFTVAVHANPGGHHHGPGHDLAADPALAADLRSARSGPVAGCELPPGQAGALVGFKVGCLPGVLEAGSPITTHGTNIGL